MKFEDTLSKSFVLLDPEVRTTRELFQSFASLLREKGVIEDEADFVSELEASEAGGSTGIGQGIALPHLMMDELDRSHILIARVREGIPFNSLDGRPAKLIILLLSAKKKRAEYLKNLARVARVLQRENVIDSLLETPDPVSVVSIVCSKHKPTYLRSHSRLLYYLGTVLAVFLLFAFIMPRVSVPEGDAAAAAGYLKYNEPEWVEKQVVAGGIFLATVIGTLLFWRHRVAIAAFGLGILLLSGTMDLETAIQFMNIPTILFLISMMVVISYMESLGFFEYIVSWIVNKTGPHPRRIFLTLMLSAGVLGGLVNEVTAIFIAVAIGISISNQLNLNPFPFVIGLVFATNTASALTMIGNPIGIYIAFAGGLNFADFLRWATPISLVIVLLITCVLLILFRKQIPARARANPVGPMTAEPDVNPGRMKVSGLLFVLLICLIGFSHEIDSLLGLLPNTSIVAIPITMAGIVIFMDREKGKMLIQEGVDWWTILFFMFLFAKAACLEYTGVTPKIAYQVLSFSNEAQGGLPGVAYSVTIVSLVVITVFTALASGFADNLPIIAALVPVIRTMEVAGLPHSSILWWGLLFGGCLGGNLTLIGSSSNMVALSIYEKSEGKVIGFVTWIKYGFPVVVISLLVALLLLVLQIGASD